MTRRNKALIIVLSILIMLSFNLTGLASNMNRYIVEEKIVDEDNGSYYIPVRDSLEKLGYEIEWDRSKKETLIKAGKTIGIRANKNTISVEGREEKLKSKPIIKGGNMYIPLELVRDHMDLDISLDEFTKELALYKRLEEDLIKKSQDKELIGKLEDYFDLLESRENFSGSVLVVNKGEELINKGFGKSNLSLDIDNKKDTTFPIGSITKQFIALSILQLEEQGKLTTEDKLDRYFPEYKYADKINLENMLNHSSGIPDFTNQPSFMEFREDQVSNEDVFKLVKDMDLVFNPGESFEYSNTNYLLLGMVVEKVSGMDLETYLDENIFKPLDMKSTGVSYGRDNMYPIATCYTGFLELTPVGDFELLKRAGGAGDMYSTTEDLYKWHRALREKKLVGQKSLDKICKNKNIMVKDIIGYAYGFFIEEDPEKLIQHGGNTFGSTSAKGYYPDKDLFIVILSNKGHNDMDGIMRNVNNIVSNGDGYDLPEELKEIEIESSLYEKYAGEYELDIMGQKMGLVVENKDENLFIKFDGQESMQVYPKSESTFFYKDLQAEIDFILDEEANPTRIKFHQMGMVFEGENKEFKEEVKEYDIDKSIYEKYSGGYISEDGMKARVDMEDEKLFVQILGQPALEIYPESETKFKYRSLDASIEFNRADDNFILRQAGMEVLFERDK